MELKRVVVTGLGAVTPLGNTAEETWNNLVAGVSGAAPITLFDASDFKTQFACEVKNLKINDFIDRKEAREIIPLNEVAYHANERKAGPLLSALKATAPYYPGGNANLLTLGIEMCIEKDGSFHPDTVARTQPVAGARVGTGTLVTLQISDASRRD